MEFSTEYLLDYIKNNNLPKISILDFWYTYYGSNIGKYTFGMKQFDIYPEDKIEIISNINDMTGDYIISANKRYTPDFLIINYLNKLNGYNSNLYTKEEYISKYLNNKKLAVCIKNFERNDSSNLVALSVKHFIPDANIYLFNFYDYRKGINLNGLDEDLFIDIINIPSKYLLGQLTTDCQNGRINGLYYTEYFNLAYKYFQNYDSKLLLLDDNHFFTNGNTLNEIINNNFDIAWAIYSGAPPKLNGDYINIPHKKIINSECGGYVNASILCINPIKFKNIFPLPEIVEYIEIILTDNLLNNNDLINYQLKNRYDDDYFDDGIHTNNYEEMKKMMIENDILDYKGKRIKYNKINIDEKITKSSHKKLLENEKIAIIIQGASKYVQEVKYAWRHFKDDLIFSTWKGEENEYDINDIVIFNEIPDISGPFNFNYQKTSTYNGLLKAKELGYTHALKIRSDYLPTNATEFINLLELDKLNFLMWDYTSFLWLDYPTLNGYIDDHFSFGKIDNMLKLWNIDNIFCHSPEIILTWSYISKLKDVELNFILNNLNENNDLYYIKFNNKDYNNTFAHNDINTNFGNRILYGRYESVFKNNTEYTKSYNEVKKFINDNYLNFLTYYNPLPKITIFSNSNIEFDILYPKHKLEIVNNIDNITGDYVICSDKLENTSTLIIEYFKKKNIMYCTSILSEQNPGNIGVCNIFTKDEFLKNN